MATEINSDIKAVKAIIEHEGKYLLANHNNQPPGNEGKWTFLGGWIEHTDNSLEEALERELYEELSLKLEIKEKVGIFEYKNRHYLVFAAHPKNTPQISSPEILDIRWYTYNQILELAQNNLLHTGFEISAFEKYFSLKLIEKI